MPRSLLVAFTLSAPILQLTIIIKNWENKVWQELRTHNRNKESSCKRFTNKNRGLKWLTIKVLVS
jgi:hypothetical protein